MTNDEDPRAEPARQLRRAGLSIRQIKARIGPVSDGVLCGWLRGVPPADWTWRPNAKDELRSRARELRRAGRSLTEIAAELGVARSSCSIWVRDLPPAHPMSADRVRAMSRARWEPELRRREMARQQTKQAAARALLPVTDRDLFIAGIALYWAEGSKDKPYRREERVTFTNSDATVIRLFWSWLDQMGVRLEDRSVRISIHELADVQAAHRFWAGVVGVPETAFAPATLKRHNPTTVRKNVGPDCYRGCLVVRVRRSAELYRRIEGFWCALAAAADEGRMPG